METGGYAAHAAWNPEERQQNGLIHRKVLMSQKWRNQSKEMKEMSIDWTGYHRAILRNLKQGNTRIEDIQDQTCLKAGDLVSVVGGLFAKKAVWSPRPGYLEITFLGEKYLSELTSDKRSKEIER